MSGEEPTDVLTQGVVCVGSLKIRHVQIMSQRMLPRDRRSPKTHSDPAMTVVLRASLPTFGCSMGRRWVIIALVSVPFPEPTVPLQSRADVFVGYLDYFRSRVVSKIEGLPESALRQSRLPSGWTPVELLKHLTYVELRWLEWGFEGCPITDPWGDDRGDRWYVAEEETLDHLVAALRAQAERSRAVIEAHDLAEMGEPSPRWDGADPATLERILFHLVQEYARHLGHLDIVAELANGQLGE